MNLTETLIFFENLLITTDKKSEIKIYKSFIEILSDLKNRNLSDYQYQLIDEKLNSFEFKTDYKNKRKQFKKKLTDFKKFLISEFSLIQEGYYTGLGIGIGMCFGLALGASIFGAGSGMTNGMMFGMFIGLIIGRNIDNKAKKEGRVLKTKP
ncbi:MAG: hypothetical protein HQ471_03975 [Flavobacteriales bacterium]|jgi:hypothetical protein|nr:hypothetical protein [Flavobacteriales bacterium]